MIAKLQTNRVRRTYLGGSRIDAFCRTAAPPCEQPCPEDWLASTTTAYNGTREIEGEGLGRLEDGRLVKDVVGTLPILVKLLDSDERLVIQAHPTVPFAKKHMNSSVGKTECWYFLPGTAPDACVYLGFKPGVTREKWAAAIRANWSFPVGAFLRNAPSVNLTEFLNRIPVRPGDLVFVEGGMPHAIGAGCFIIELQEPSDLMVVAERWTPSGREIVEGKRFGGLDWEKMLDVYSYASLSLEEIRSRFIRSEPEVGPDLTDKFEMRELGAFRRNAPTGGAAAGGCNSPNCTELALEGAGAVVIVTEGAGSLNGLAVRKGDRLVVKDERLLTATGTLRTVVCFGAKKDDADPFLSVVRVPSRARPVSITDSDTFAEK